MERLEAKVFNLVPKASTVNKVVTYPQPLALFGHKCSTYVNELSPEKVPAVGLLILSPSGSILPGGIGV